MITAAEVGFRDDFAPITRFATPPVIGIYGIFRTSKASPEVS
jgi:hypothetical protein